MSSYREVTPEQAFALHAEGEAVLLDVRTLPEWHGAHVPGAIHLPMDELPARVDELDPDATTLVLCAHGIRSAHVARWLASLGFRDVVNIRLGISRWPGPTRSGDG